MADQNGDPLVKFEAGKMCLPHASDRRVRAQGQTRRTPTGSATVTSVDHDTGTIGWEEWPDDDARIWPMPIRRLTRDELLRMCDS